MDNMSNKDISLDDDILKELLSKISDNTKTLLSEKFQNSTLIQNATSRGMRVLKGELTKQLIIDLCSIALTLLIQNTRTNR